MSDEIETINLEEVLDYELEDVEELDVEMNPQQEDDLLDETGTNCVIQPDDEQERENELVRKMSMTSVSSAAVTTTEPSPILFFPTSIPISNDFWGKSISTFVSVLKTSVNEPAVEPPIASNLHVNLDLIQQPVIDMIPSVQPPQQICVPGNERTGAPEREKLETKSIETIDTVSTPPDPVGTSQSDGLTSTSSSPSTSTSSSIKVNSKRSKNKKRRSVNKNVRFVQSKRRAPSIPSLMSINTQLAFPRTRFPILIPTNVVPTETIRKKTPFIIKAHINGDSVSRTVTTNPLFERFRTTKVANPIVTSTSQLSAALNNLDFNNVAISKRRSTTSLELFRSDNRVPITNPTPLPMSIDAEEMSDEDKKYLMAIEEQKKKREELIRQKEWKRDMEGWQFLAD